MRELTKARNISLNKLMDELATRVLAEFDAHNRFNARAARGRPERGLALLDRLDALKGG